MLRVWKMSVRLTELSWPWKPMVLQIPEQRVELILDLLGEARAEHLLLVLLRFALGGVLEYLLHLRRQLLAEHVDHAGLVLAAEPRHLQGAFTEQGDVDAVFFALVEEDAELLLAEQPRHFAGAGEAAG